MPRLLSADVLQSRIRELQQQAQKLERDAAKGLRAAAKVISKHGLLMTDLHEAFKMSKGRGKRGSLAGTKVAPKYRDESGNTWTGRGRPPLWLVAAEKAGKMRDSFLIDAPKPKAKAVKPKKAPTRKRSAKKGTKSAPAQTAA